jgi:hypothetical protein
MRKPREYSYDPSCYKLAEAFIADENIAPEDREKLLDELSQDIQNTIEDFFTFELTYVRGADGKMYRRIKE